MNDLLPKFDLSHFRGTTVKFPRVVLCIILGVAIAGCTANPNSRQFVGAGVDLYTARTDRDTERLQAYIHALCRQAGLAVVREQGTYCPSQMPGNYYPVLVRTGFNDIDLRCDRYLNYIDVKRIEALQFKGGLSATQTLLGVVSSGDTLRYVVAAFGFADSIYDRANISMLAALESSTIKTLVYKRQKAFRAESAARPAGDRAAMIFALRNYLAICTPQTIVLKANTFSRDPASGTDAAIREDYKEQFAAQNTLRATDPVNVRPPRPAPPTPIQCPGCGALFTSDFANATTADVKLAQRLLCQPPDGVAGNSTLAAVRMFEMIYAPDPVVSRDGKLSESELGFLGADKACEGEEYRTFWNPYEASTYANNPAALEPFIVALNRAHPGTNVDPKATFASAELRAKIASARAALNMRISLPTRAGIDPNGQLTVDFENRIIALGG